MEKGIDALYDFVKENSGNVDLIERSVGALMSGSIGKDGEAALYFIDRDTSLYIATNIDYVSDKVRPRRDQNALVALTEAFEDLLQR